MWATLYRPLSEEYPTFRAAKMTDIFKIISYNYVKRFYSVGEFSMDIPINEPAVPYIVADTILITDDGDDLYVTDTEETATTFTIKGYDLKCLLAMRLSLFPSKEQAAGAYGYYVVKGSTEYCLKDIVRYNITESEDENRRIYGFAIAENQDSGLDDDRYMTRLETLDMVAGTMCKNAEMGWDVTADIANNRYVFDVIAPTDRSDNQHEVSKVVFAEQFLNVAGVTRQLGVSALKNAVYAVNGSGSNDPYVQLVNRDDEAAVGVFRKETTVNVNCDYDEIQDYALKESEDKIQVDVFEMEVQAADTYKKEWFIGDIVSFKHGGLQLDSSIVQVEVSRTADKYEVRLTAGENVPTAIGSLSSAVSSSNNNKIILSGNGYGVGRFTNTAKNSEKFNDYENNTATGSYLHVGGQNNHVTGVSSSILGGSNNNLTGQDNSIDGGNGNTINGSQNVIGGGFSNTVNDTQNVIGGGNGNTIGSGSQNGIFSGLFNNIIRGIQNVIAGGQSNKIEAGSGSNDHNFIGSGIGNTVTGSRNVIVGGQNNSMSGSGYDIPYDSFIGGGYSNQLSGGVSKSAIVVGNNNKIQGSNPHADFIGAGWDCTIYSINGYNFLGTGQSTSIQGSDNTVFGSRIVVINDGTFAHGRDLKSDRDNQVLFGYSNKPTDGKGVFVIAAGRNLAMLDENGNLYLTGNVYTNYPGSGGGATEAAAVSTYTADPNNSSDKGYTGNVEVAAGKTLVFENGILKSVIEEE